jgi:hypothetical protein
MKKILFILSLLCFTGTGLFAQDEEDNEGNEKIRDKMSEYIQNRMNLSDKEAKKFIPVFIRYFKEWRQTIKDNKGDALVRQQKIVDLRLRYRTQFREVLGEQRGDRVFLHQDAFIRELKELNDIRKERMRNNPNRPLKRAGVNMLNG